MCCYTVAEERVTSREMMDQMDQHEATERLQNSRIWQANQGQKKKHAVGLITHGPLEILVSGTHLYHRCMPSMSPHFSISLLCINAPSNISTIDMR